MFLQAFLEKLLGNDTGLWQAVYPILYLTVDIAVGTGLVPEVIVLEDVFRHVYDAQLHAFVPGHQGVQLKVLDVLCHEFCANC
jgi:hypothetical protein